MGNINETDDPGGTADRTTAAPITYLQERRLAVTQRSEALDDGRRSELDRRLADDARSRLRDARLGYPFPEQARRHHDYLIAQVHDDIQRSASVHRRVPWLVRQIPWTVAILDCLVLYTFCADVFNVPPAPLSVPRAVASMLAMLGSGITYTWLSLTGTRLRDWRNELGEVEWALTGTVTRLMVLTSLVVTAALAVLMYHRITMEASTAAAAGYLTAADIGVIAAVFATLSVAANLAVIAVHLLDGSREADELRHVGKVLCGFERAHERLRRQVWRRSRRRARP